jgi:[ribosomal protein S5]-alanine N-acetyltransferase
MTRQYFMRSQRLGFGLWTPEDIDLASALWGDGRVTRLIGGSFSEEQIHARLAQEIANQAEHGLQYWPLFRLSDAAHIGCCGLRPYPARAGVGELGFHLRYDYWRQGYASEAARRVICHAFTDLQAPALFAGHHPDNTASHDLLLRLGFSYTQDEYYPPTGRQHPSYFLYPETTP